MLATHQHGTKSFTFTSTHKSTRLHQTSPKSQRKSPPDLIGHNLQTHGVNQTNPWTDQHCCPATELPTAMPTSIIPALRYCSAPAMLHQAVPSLSDLGDLSDHHKLSYQLSSKASLKNASWCYQHTCLKMLPAWATPRSDAACHS